MSDDESVPRTTQPPEPTIRIEEVPWDFQVEIARGLGKRLVLDVEDKDRVFLFLDYGIGFMWHRYRWVIVARASHEDMMLHKAFMEGTHERGLHLIPREVQLAREAMSMIRSGGLR